MVPGRPTKRSRVSKIESASVCTGAVSSVRPPKVQPKTPKNHSLEILGAALPVGGRGPLRAGPAGQPGRCFGGCGGGGGGIFCDNLAVLQHSAVCRKQRRGRATGVRKSSAEAAHSAACKYLRSVADTSRAASGPAGNGGVPEGPLD